MADEILKDKEQFFDCASEAVEENEDSESFVDAPQPSDSECQATDSAEENRANNWDPFPDVKQVFPESVDATNVDVDEPTCSVVDLDEVLELRRTVEQQMSDEQLQELFDESVTLKTSGNQCFVGGQFDEAIELYDQALEKCPLKFTKQHAILWCNRAAAHIRQENMEAAIKDCSQAIELDPTYYKAYYRRAICYEKNEDKWDQALEDYKTVLTHEPNNPNARAAVQKLPPLIEERNAKMKDEMMGKLKELGNMVLRPFGLSTENFQLVPNGEGGYSVSMTNK